MASGGDGDGAFHEVPFVGCRGARKRGFGDFHPELRRVERLEGGARLRRGNARAQPREHVEPPGAAIRDSVGQRRQPAGHHDRHENLRRRAFVDAVESLLRDADDGHCLTVDDQRLADDRGIAAEAGLPVGMAQHRHQVAVRDLVFIRVERAPQVCPDAEHREVRAGDELTLDALRALREAHLQGVAEPAEHPGEHVIVIAEVGVPRVGKLVAVTPAVSVLRTLGGDDDELLGMCDRQQSNQNLVDQREDCRIRADSQRDREHGDGGEDRGFAQAAEAYRRSDSTCVMIADSFVNLQ